MRSSKLLPLAIVLLAAGSLWYFERPPELASEHVESPENESTRFDAPHHAPERLAIERLYELRQSDVQVQGAGAVSKILSDDNKGSRHQRFILELASGHTLLIAHNIDLAPRIESLQEGDRIEFFGEYAWNDKGGVVHWTHDDPQGRHVAGWLKHQGKMYQ